MNLREYRLGNKQKEAIMFDILLLLGTLVICYLAVTLGVYITWIETFRKK